MTWTLLRWLGGSCGAIVFAVACAGGSADVAHDGDDEDGDAGSGGQGASSGGSANGSGGTGNGSGGQAPCGESCPEVTTDLAVGDSHSCALSSRGQVKCWGHASVGQLGIGTYGEGHDRGDDPDEMGVNLPAVELGEGTVVDVEVGTSHSCARFDDGQVTCWGSNEFGQLGLGDRVNRGATVGDMADLDFVDSGSARSAQTLALGANHSCALLDDGSVKCWGLGSSGQLGTDYNARVGEEADQMGDNLSPIFLGTGRSAKGIAARGNTSCAILDTDELKCWGDNGDGQLGQGDDENRGWFTGQMAALEPIDVGGPGVLQASIGYGFVCALLDDASVKCWGRNVEGQLGQGNTTPRGAGANEMGSALPALELGTRQPVALSSVGDHTCVLFGDAHGLCWGANSFGQLGRGDVEARGDDPDELEPTSSIDWGAGRTAVQIAAGGWCTCALLDDGNVKCWGIGGPQLGQGNTDWLGDGPGEMGEALPLVQLW